jgi:hypothetical protein
VLACVTAFDLRQVLAADNLSVDDGESFTAMAKRLPWDLFERSSLPESVKTKSLSKLTSGLVRFAIKEPLVAIDEKCQSPLHLPDPVDIDCGKHGAVFQGKRSKPAKIAHMIQFGYDVDVLEIHLREVYDLVDVFFVLESTRTHNRLVAKPLIWELIKDQPRFEIFQDKIVHIVLDDTESEPSGDEGNKMFFLENKQEGIRFEKFLQWNAHRGNLFGDDDIVGFGDTDKVPWRNNLQLLKFCQPMKEEIDIGIWFPMGTLDNAFRSDWPVPDHPFTLGDPTFYTVRGALAAQKAGKVVSRNRGRSGSFLLGGMHMTRHRYLPFLVLESITCSECSGWKPSLLHKLKKQLTIEPIKKTEEYWDDINLEPFIYRTHPVTMLGNEAELIRKVPWFLSCNPKRYPYWWGEHDTRLGP